jgi:hypothetical protein
MTVAGAPRAARRTRPSAQIAVARWPHPAQFVRDNHPRVLQFEIYIDDDAREMTVIQIHPDEASLMLHMQLAGDRIARAYEFLDTVVVRMFGNASETFMQGAMGGREDVRFERPFAGFSRLETVAV